MYQNQFKTKLLLSTAAVVLGLAAPAVVTAQEAAESPPAAATANQPEEKLEEVVVTGTSIRGAPPVGSNVITVGREAIEATSVQSAQQLLKLVPAITGMGSAGQGAYGTFDTGSGGDSPNIHGLGGVSSSTTLTLIDGHRIPLTGIIRNLADPNILPPNAVERVEVMPEGASSVYGSDAVAGVVNFITRKHFDGFEVDAQDGEANGYKTYSGGFLGGKTWDDASALLAYSYSYGSDLSQADRQYTLSNHLAVGGSNFGSFACSPATIFGPCLKSRPAM